MRAHAQLHLAAYRGHPEIVKHLLLHKADPNIGNENNDLPTHLAALARQTACLKVLLDPGINPAKVNIDAHDAQGYCALHYACGEGHLELARALLQTYGADVESRNNDGLTPIMCAVQQGHKPVAEMLISMHPTCIEATNNSGDSCLHYATIAEGTGMLEMLLRHGADPHLKNKDGLTPLHEAVVEKQAESAELLKRVMNGLRSETGAMMNAATRRVLVGRILDSSAGSASTDCHTNHDRAGLNNMLHSPQQCARAGLCVVHTRAHTHTDAHKHTHTHRHRRHAASQAIIAASITIHVGTRQQRCASQDVD